MDVHDDDDVRGHPSSHSHRSPQLGAACADGIDRGGASTRCCASDCGGDGGDESGGGDGGDRGGGDGGERGGGGGGGDGGDLRAALALQ